MSKFAKPLMLLAPTLLSILLCSLFAIELQHLLGLTSELDYHIVNKELAAMLLLGSVLCRS